MTPSVALDSCEMRPECLRRFQDIKDRQDALEAEQRIQGKDLAALQAKVALAGAVGAIIGSGAAALLSRLLGH